MFNNPLHSSSFNYTSPYLSPHHGLGTMEPLPKYSSSMYGSLSLASPGRGGPAPPPPTPVNAYNFPAGSMSDPYASFYDLNSSRSTSSYTTLSSGFDALPLASSATTAAAQKKQVEMRLPSDQLRQIINALNPHKMETASAMMPPPPLPPPKTPAVTDSRHNSRGNATDERSPLTAIRSAHDTRDSSRCSDISMHPNCPSFPACIQEDAEGSVVHLDDSPDNKYIRSKKESSSSSPKKSQCML